MAQIHNMAPALLIYFPIIMLANAHNENPGNLVGESSELENPVQRDYRRRDAEWNYEGIPIEVPQARRELTTTRTVPTATVATETLRPYPPLHPRYRRIYNPDERALVDEFPFMAAVLVNKELWCGAAIIDRDRVLTAAHCLQLQYNNRFFREYVKMLTVRVGSTNATAGGEVLRVVEIAFHPNYKPATLGFNVAVLRLHKNLTFDRVDFPVERIPYSREPYVSSEQNITFLGWGSVLGGGGKGGTVLLQQLEIPVYEFADCQQTYGKELVTNSNFCAGFITIPKNVCNHDAGGPAIMDGKLVGILSFSSKRCDAADQPAVFVTVGAVAPWLDNIGEIKPKPMALIKDI